MTRDAERDRPHPASQGDLVGEGVLGFCIQLGSMGVDDGQVSRVLISSGQSQVRTKRGRDDFVTVGPVRRASIEGSPEIFGKGDYGLNHREIRRRGCIGPGEPSPIQRERSGRMESKGPVALRRDLGAEEAQGREE